MMLLVFVHLFSVSEKMQYLLKKTVCVELLSLWGSNLRLQ